jgi:hypothetical protein
VSEPRDSRFVLPSLDDPGSTEAGIILLGLDAERLLAGVGFAELSDDPALVTQAVDHARHGVPMFGFTGLMAAGARRWTRVRPAIAATTPMEQAGSLRQEWEHTERRVAEAAPGTGPASVGYLAACWLRRADVDRLAEGRAGGKGPSDVVSEIPAG